jgi:replicative DNA helicase
MLDEEAAAVAVDLCDPAFFCGDKRHEEIFDAICTVFRKGTDVSIQSVEQEMESDPGVYLMDLTKEVGTTGNVEYHSRILAERWMEREGRKVLQAADGHLADGGDVFDTLGRVTKKLTEISMQDGKDTHIERGAQEAFERLDEWKRGEDSSIIHTGFPGLDDMIVGYPVGELTTFAAQTGAGKTSWLVQTVGTLARAWKGTEKTLLVFSAEMNQEQIAQKAASQIARADLRALRTGDAPDAAYERYEEALGLISTLNLHVDDTPKPSLQHIRARCQRLDVQHDLAFVAVDYDEKVGAEQDTEEQRVAEIARSSKGLAKSFDAAWINLSQYSRKSYDTGVPQDGWLRYSGKKEQESALILHWYWPGYWVKNKGHDPLQVDNYDEAEPMRGWICCTKNRHTGGTGMTKLYFKPKHTRFFDPADPEVDLSNVQRPPSEQQTYGPEEPAF